MHKEHGVLCTAIAIFILGFDVLGQSGVQADPGDGSQSQGMNLGGVVILNRTESNAARIEQFRKVLLSHAPVVAETGGIWYGKSSCGTKDKEVTSTEADYEQTNMEIYTHFQSLTESRKDQAILYIIHVPAMDISEQGHLSLFSEPYLPLSSLFFSERPQRKACFLIEVSGFEDSHQPRVSLLEDELKEFSAGYCLSKISGDEKVSALLEVEQAMSGALLDKDQNIVSIRQVFDSVAKRRKALKYSAEHWWGIAEDVRVAEIPKTTSKGKSNRLIQLLDYINKPSWGRVSRSDFKSLFGKSKSDEQDKIMTLLRAEYFDLTMASDTKLYLEEITKVQKAAAQKAAADRAAAQKAAANKAAAQKAAADRAAADRAAAQKAAAQKAAAQKAAANKAATAEKYRPPP